VSQVFSFFPPEVNSWANAITLNLGGQENPMGFWGISGTEDYTDCGVLFNRRKASQLQ